MGSTSPNDQLYSPVPGVIPGQIDVARSPVAPKAPEDSPPTHAQRPAGVRRRSAATSSQHLRPLRTSLVAAALLTLAIVCITLAVFAL